MNNKYKILVIEDDANIRGFLTALLESGGYQPILARDCRDGLTMFSSHTPDLIILDLGLPDYDGTRLLSKVREYSSTPIIVLSARSDEADKVSALDMGANDYVTKPFGSAELMARVRGILRNSTSRAEMARLPDKKFISGDMEIDYDRRQIFLSGTEIKLTQTEYNIITLLASHAGKVLTYSTIIKEIWGASDVSSTKKLQVNMANIRKKLGIRPGDNKYIVNLLGVGYRFDEG